MSLSLHAQLSVDICIDISIARSRFRAPLARARGPAIRKKNIDLGTGNYENVGGPVPRPVYVPGNRLRITIDIFST